MKRARFFLLLIVSLYFMGNIAYAVTADDYYESATSKYFFGDIAGARDDLKNALSLNPAHERSKAMLSEIERELIKTQPPAPEPPKPAPEKPKTTPQIRKAKIKTPRAAAPVKIATKEAVATIEAAPVIAATKEAAVTKGSVTPLLAAGDAAAFYFKKISDIDKIRGALFGLAAALFLAVMFILFRRGYKICPICGARYSARSEFCLKCGSKVTEWEMLGERVKRWYRNFGWRKNPFTLEIMPELFTGYEDIVSRVIEKVVAKSGHILITGNFGVGKTTFLKWLERKFSMNFYSIYVPRPPKQIEEMIDLIVSRVGLRGKHNIYSLGRKLNKLRKSVLLLIDEAHEFVIETERPMRTLGDMEKICFIIAGLPETREKFRNEIPALYERIVLDVPLEKLGLNDIKELIKKRMSEAGGKDLGPFGDNVLQKIHEVSGGNPRKAIKICDAAIFKAIENGKTIIDISTIG